MTARQLEIYVDIASADAYLAHAPIRALLARTGIKACWHPAAAPRAKLAAITEEPESVSARHQRVRQAYRNQDVARYAAWQGLAFDPNGAIDAVAAAAGLLSAQDAGAADRYLTAAFARHFADPHGPLDEAAVDNLLEALNCQPLSPTLTERVALALAAAEEDGVFDVPTLMIDGERFVGRQHLPLLERVVEHGAQAVIPPVR